MNRILSCCLSGTLLSLLVLAGGVVSVATAQPSVTGQWSTLAPAMPINPVHVALLKNGKVLIVAGSGNCPPGGAGCPAGAPYGPSNNSGAAVWDPIAGSVTQLSLNWDMFCNSMVVLADGRVFINGGTLQYDPFHGSPKSSIFDPANNSFTDVQNMAHGRWYPTTIVLGDGRVMTFSGLTETGSTNSAVEFYTVGSGWSQQYPESGTPPLYPRLHLLPNGKVFYSGPSANSALFDPALGSWTDNVASTNYGGLRTYGSSVLLPLTPANNYDPKVMIFGGGNPATATTEIIDMGAATPQWVTGPPMSQPRIEMNAILLPNGKVLAMGGSKNDEDTNTLSLNADLFDLGNVDLSATPPVVGTRSSAGANATQRLYHSVALLLPDATVWLAGGNPVRGSYNASMEIYKPPYLFNSNGTLATRPTITSAPSSISHGAPFTVQTPDAANISSAVLVRAGSTTHAFNMDQRLVGMSFTVGSGTLTVTAPPNSNIAPPGYYMLFLLNNSGVPSVASFVQLAGSSAPPPPPTGISFVQSNTGPPSLQASNSTVAVAFTGAQTAGNLNVVAVGWGDTTSTITSVTDTRNNVYTLALGPTTNSAGLRQSIYYAKNIAAGSNTVTVRFNQAAVYPDVRILEYAGADPNNPLDAKLGATGTGTAPNSGSVTTAVANELIFGSGTSGAHFTAAGTGFVSRMINAFGNIAEDKTGATAGSYSATATTTSAPWVMQVATFRAGGQAPPPPPPPSVSTISPTTGTTAGGTSVTITGTGFQSGASVTFGGTAASNVSVVGSTSLTATTPAHTAGAVNVVVTNTDGQSGTLNSGYTYVSAAPAPTVTSVSPVSGPTSGGTSVTITGTGFLSGATVTFGGTAATNVVVGSGTQITATTPAHAVGAVTVTVTNSDTQSGSLNNGYTYLGSPTVSSVTPNSGPTTGGTAVTIVGTNFVSGATVSFGGTLATNVTVVNGTQITATTPAHAAGAVTVTVTNPDTQSGSLTSGFTYSSATAPTVSSVTPNSGPAAGNTAVTIAGTNFVAGAQVTFGGTAATNVVVVNGTQITATTPAHAAGAVTVTVTNTDTQSGTLANGYTYTGTITFVQANTGPPNLQASNSSVAVAFSAVQAAGHLNVVAVGWGDTTSTISSVTDTRGNVYTLAIGPTTNSAGLRQSIYYAKNIAAGSNTITVTFSKAAVYPDVRILEYAGADATNPLDAKLGATGTGTTANSGSVTTVAPSELIFGSGTSGSHFTAAGTGFTSRMINAFGNIAEDKIGTTAGSYNATATTVSAPWVMQVVTFK